MLQARCRHSDIFSILLERMRKSCAAGPSAPRSRYQLRRRELITLLGGATAAWPLAARAQQPERMRRIGVFVYLAADDPESSVRLGAFRQGLRRDAGLSSSRAQLCCKLNQV